MKKRNIISVLLICFLLFFAFSTGYATEGNKPLNQEKGIKAYEKLIKSFEKEKVIYYPDYYGGSYLDSEGKLVINVVGMKEDDVVKVKNVLNDEENVTYTGVNFSFEQLKQAYKTLSELMLALDLCSVELNEVDNVVYVYVNNLDEEKEQKIHNLVDSPMINILNNKVTVKFSSAIPLINSYYVKTPEDGGLVSTSTLGFCGKVNNEPGMIIAGHAIDVGDWCKYYSYDTVGYCSDKRLGGSTDAAFVPIDDTSEFEPTAELGSGESIYSWASWTYVPVGTVVRMFGQKSGITSGEVLSKDFSLTINGIPFTDMIKSDYESQEGDSGAPIIRKSPIYNDNYLAGTQSMVARYEDETFAYSVASKIENILDSLSIDYVYLDFD